MSNPNIKNYASMGGRTRATRLTPIKRRMIAKQAVDARIRKLGQTDRQDINNPRIMPIPDTDWRAKYLILANFIRSKGGDPSEIVEQEETEKGLYDEVISD